MQAAKDIARQASLDQSMPTGSVVVRNGQILGRGANGSNYHKEHACVRVQQNIPTGQGYDLCEGCHPKNHSELRAVADALVRSDRLSLEGCTLYLWGHWWCCEPCWNTMLANGIQTVYLLEGSEKLFNKMHPENVVGKQFIA